MVEDPMVPVIPVIEKWVQEGQVVTNSDLKHFIRKLRKIHRFSHALQSLSLLSTYFSVFACAHLVIDC